MIRYLCTLFCKVLLSSFHIVQAKPNLRQEQVLSSQELDPAEEEDLARTNIDNIENRIR